MEGHNYDIRKHLLKYDDVMNLQRKVVYGMRRQILEQKDLRPMMEEFMEVIADSIAADFAMPRSPLSDWDFEGLNQALSGMLYFDFRITREDLKEPTEQALFDAIYDKLIQRYEAKRTELGEYIDEVQMMFTLSTIDHRWKEHLLQMDHLREGIGLRGYAQKDPLLEYKKESFYMFQTMQGQIKQESIAKIFNVQLRDEAAEAEIERYERERQREVEMARHHGAQANPQAAMAGAAAGASMAQGGGGSATPAPQPVTSSGPKVGRNDPCPCGSGKKYKKCHGR